MQTYHASHTAIDMSPGQDSGAVVLTGLMVIPHVDLELVAQGSWHGLARAVIVDLDRHILGRAMMVAQGKEVVEITGPDRAIHSPTEPKVLAWLADDRNTDGLTMARIWATREELRLIAIHAKREGITRWLDTTVCDTSAEVIDRLRKLMRVRQMVGID